MSLVQSGPGSGASGSLSQPTGIGTTLIVAAYGSRLSTSIPTPQTGSGAFFTKIASVGTGPQLAIFALVTTQAENSITGFTADSTTTGGGVTAWAYEEQSNLLSSPIDQSASNSGSSTSASSGSTLSTSQASEVVVGAVGFPSGSASAGSGYAFDQSSSDSNTRGSAYLATEYKTVSSIGPQTAAFGVSPSNPWLCVVATFKMVTSTPHTASSSETVTATDTPTRLVGFLRAAPESAAIADARSRFIAALRRIAETITGVGSSGQSPRTLPGQLPMTLGMRSATGSVMDAVSAIHGQVRQIAETVHVSDNLNALRLKLAAIADAVAATDSAKRTASYARSLPETVASSGLLTAARTWIRSITETIRAVDAVLGAKHILLAVTETFPAFADFNQQFNRAISETLPAFTDTATAVRHVYRRVIDYMPRYSDVVTAAVGLFRSAGKRL